MDALLPVRSVLFAPANRPDLIHKFLRCRVDAFVIDLEDATPENSKDEARGELSRVVADLREHGLKGRLFVRINECRSAHFKEDTDAASRLALDGVVIPKLETIGDLENTASCLPDTFGVIGLVETALGIVNVDALVAAGVPHLCAIAFG